MVAALKNGIAITQSQSTLLDISYTGLNPTTCQKIVEILANQCKELLLRTKSQETREALRYIEQQYTEADQKLAELEKELAAKKVAEFDKGPEAKIALITQRQAALDAMRVVAKDWKPSTPKDKNCWRRRKNGRPNCAIIRQSLKNWRKSRKARPRSNLTP